MKRRAFLSRLVAGAAGLFGAGAALPVLPRGRRPDLFTELLHRIDPWRDRTGSWRLEVDPTGPLAASPAVCFDFWVGPKGVPHRMCEALWQPGLVAWRGRTWRLAARSWYCDPVYPADHPGPQTCRAYFRARLEPA